MCASAEGSSRSETFSAPPMSDSPPPPQRLTVVLLGQTGNGKSATGNALLGRNAFVAKRSFSSVTERCDAHVSDGSIHHDNGDFELCVIDTPGTCDSGALLEDNLVHISKYLRGEEGGETGGDEKKQHHVHAFILVLSAASRFTQEEAIALERLVGRIGEKALRHFLVVVTRAEEVVRESREYDGSIEATAKLSMDLVQSAPVGLRNLLQRMPFHQDGTPPILVENFPTAEFPVVTTNPNAYTTSQRPILSVLARLTTVIAAERGLNITDDTYLASCAYSPEDLQTANQNANNNPSTAALAMLDRFKKQLVEGKFGGGGDDVMAGAAKRAFEDLAAQFTARASPGGLPIGAVNVGPGSASNNAPFHQDGTPPILVENFPTAEFPVVTTNPNAYTTSQRPILSVLARLTTVIAAERGLNITDDTYLASCAYSPEDLQTANQNANNNPSTAALAMLDRFKKQLVEGKFGGGGDDVMAGAAKRAFEDLAAQFTARASPGGLPIGAVNVGPGSASNNANPSGFGLFGGTSDDTSVATNRPSTLFCDDDMLGVFKAGEDANENEIDLDDCSINVAGYGDVYEASGSCTLSKPTAIAGLINVLPPKFFEEGVLEEVLNKKRKVPAEVSKNITKGRARVAGRVSSIDGNFMLTSKGETHAVTLHSPVFTRNIDHITAGCSLYTPQRSIRDDDWVEEGVYFVPLVDEDSGDVIKVVCRGSLPGETPQVELMVTGRFELQGGSLSVQNATLHCGAMHGDFVFEGTLDASASVEFNYFKNEGEHKTATFLPNPKWPWKE